MRISSILFMTLAVAAISNALRAEDWPQWRGPARNGISQETGLLQEWPTEGPKLLWSVKDLGDGYSTPAIAGGRIYLISNEGLDNEYVQALSVDGGKPIWKTKLGKVGKPNQMPPYPCARSTTTVDGDLTYSLGSDGDLVCCEAATGKEVWRKNLLKDFDGVSGIWAYAESPLVDGDAVVVTPGGEEATLLALNKKTGDVIRKYPVPSTDDKPEAAGYASIVVMNVGGVKQYVQFLGKGVVGVDATTGKFLWRYDHTAKGSPANIATPAADDGYVYSASKYAGGGLVRISPDSDGFKADEVYLNLKLPKAIGGFVLLDEYLYGTSDKVTQCVEFKTGSVKWTQDRGVAPASILYADKRLYLHGEKEGDVSLIGATPEGYKEYGHYTPPNIPEKRVGQAWEYPVIADGKLYIHDWGTLWCYDIKAGGNRAASRDVKTGTSR